MNAKKLKMLMKENSGNMKKFAKDVGIPYTTILTSCETDKRLDSMPIGNFIRIADGLSMTPQELAKELEFTYELVEY